MSICCTRRLSFCAGHRVLGHEGKCSHVHGHEYSLEVTAKADKLDSVGRVIDFSKIKELLGGFIDEQWDHGFLLNIHDTNVLDALVTIEVAGGGKQKIYPMPYNPTAENLASHLLHIVCPKLFHGTGITITKVIVHETGNCYATAELCNQ